MLIELETDCTRWSAARRRTSKINANGIENPSKTYMVGVQFHPENDVKLAMVEHKSTPADAELMLNFFKNFVKYAAK